MTMEELSPTTFEMSGLWTTPRRRAFSFLLSLTEFSLQMVAYTGLLASSSTPARAVIEDEYIADDPKKDALPGVDG
jgi:hypothetical protein